MICLNLGSRLLHRHLLFKSTWMWFVNVYFTYCLYAFWIYFPHWTVNFWEDRSNVPGSLSLLEILIIFWLHQVLIEAWDTLIFCCMWTLGCYVRIQFLDQGLNPSPALRRGITATGQPGSPFLVLLIPPSWPMAGTQNDYWTEDKVWINAGSRLRRAPQDVTTLLYLFSCYWCYPQYLVVSNNLKFSI